MNITRKFAFAIAVMLCMVSCSTKKKLTDNIDATTSATPVTGKLQQEDTRNTELLQKITDCQMTTKNIVADMTFKIKLSEDNVNLPGSLHMRKNEMIRLQLFIPLLGSEIARIEFTPKGVLIVDRMHKQYINATYSDLDFLKNNGLDFYTLQALFWNQLSIPGTKAVTSSNFNKFTVNDDGKSILTQIGYEQSGLKFIWDTERQTNRILTTRVNYNSSSHGTSMLSWNYSNFVNVGGKMYPSQHNISFNTTATGTQKSINVAIEASDIKTSSNWELQTKVSDKYKKVEAEDMFKELFKL